MGLEENKELVARAWAAYDKGDEAGFLACLTDDWKEYEAGEDPIGAQEVLASMSPQREAFPDKTTEILITLAEGDLVAMQSKTTATHTGTYFDVEPTGKQCVTHEISIHRIRDGKIEATYQETSSPGYYQQLTGRPSPGGLDNMG
jgi:predicted ester cyclase